MISNVVFPAAIGEDARDGTIQNNMVLRCYHPAARGGGYAVQDAPLESGEGHRFGVVRITS